jgi:hypothetical protein
MNQSSFTSVPGSTEYNNQLNSLPLLARAFLGNQSNTTSSNWGNFYKNAIASQNVPGTRQGQFTGNPQPKDGILDPGNPLPTPEQGQQGMQQLNNNLAALAGQQQQQTAVPQLQVDPYVVPIASNDPIQRTSPLQALGQIYGGYQNSSPKVLGLLSKYGGGK